MGSVNRVNVGVCLFLALLLGVACSKTEPVARHLGPEDVLAKLSAAGFTVEKQTGSYTHKFGEEDLLLFFKLDGVELLGLRFPTPAKASDWCETRKRCRAADIWVIDADQRATPYQEFPGGRIKAALSAE